MDTGRGRESAPQRPRCYCRLAGAKSRTNRPTTYRGERPSTVASLNCLVSTWNFHVWCDSDFAMDVLFLSRFDLDTQSEKYTYIFF